MNICKLLQKQTYNFLSHRCYVACFIFLVFTTIISLVHLCEVWLNRVWLKEERVWFNNFVDNIGHSSLAESLCQYDMPIDVVYTWVNGSDPLFRSQLLQYQRDMQKVITESCRYSDCLPSHFTALEVVLSKELKEDSRYTTVVTNTSRTTTQNWKLFSWDSPQAAAADVANKLSGNTEKVSQAHWTSDGSILNIYSPKDVILFRVPEGFQNRISRAVLTSWLGDSVRAYWLYPERNMAVVQLKTTASYLLQGNSWNIIQPNGIKLNVTEAHLFLEIPTTIKPSDYEASRYDDKEELRYSLRSLERFAPWVRKIFVITNGQIPHWLELENPRLSLITHAMIFPNRSHLPTFSSPAIETHLHRIPGLSQKFLYMNDDLLLGDDVLPEDFISSRLGQKVYLSWPIPDCTSSCPWSWVEDGACDLPCNVSACAFDGGDCDDASGEVKILIENDLNRDYEVDDGNGMRNKRDTAKVKRSEKLIDRKTRSLLKCLTKSNGFLKKTISFNHQQKKECSDFLSDMCDFSKSTKFTDLDVSYSQCKVILQLFKERNVFRPREMFDRRSKEDGNLYHRMRRSVINRNANANYQNASDNLAWVYEYNLKKSRHSIGKSDTEMKNAAKARVKELGKLYVYNDAKSAGRRLDTYAESLLHVNSLLNSRYGFKRRKVPAHMPHLIDKSIMGQLQSTFPKEFDRTSSHSIRSSDDMQFAFSYFYYLMSEEVGISAGEIFDTFDTDSTGTWSDREIRTVLTRLYPLPLQQSGVLQFEKLLMDCAQSRQPFDTDTSTPMYERYLGSILPLITKTMVVNCSEVMRLLQEAFGHHKRFSHTVVQHQESVGFYMVGSNLSDLLLTLDQIRHKPKKFICLNDNMDSRRVEDNEIVRAALIDFYHSLYPKPSQFELPPEYRNRFLYYDDYTAWKSHRSIVSKLITFVILIVGVFAFACIFSNEVCWLLKRVLLHWRRGNILKKLSKRYIQSI